VRHPKQFGVPFDVNGDPKQKVILLERGVVKNFLGEGHATRGITEHPYDPQNLVIEGGNMSLGEIFSRIRKGVFINKIRYHTVVRESTMEVTGLVSAGGLYLENGQVVGRVAHLRYHDSLFSILSSVRGATKETLLLKDGETGAALFPYLWISRIRMV
jgi:predicted Zn-dependent protease